MIKTKHKVTVSCGTKFHSDYTSFQLQKHGLLNQVITAHPKRKYLNRVNLNSKLLTFVFPFFVGSYLLNKLLGKSSKLSRWLDYKMPLAFDGLSAKKLKGSNVLLTWAWSGLKTIKEIKKRRGIALVEECGSCSKFQNQILEEEYQNLGLVFKNPTPDFIVKRQLEEARLADYLLCPSNHVVNSFVENGISKKKCVVIPYGVNNQIFKPKWLVKDEFIVICVGTVGVRKGYVYLFKALEILKLEINIKCIIIGKVEDQFLSFFNNYQHLFTHYNHVPHHELVNFYNDASLFVLPSLDEGMALVQLEAMACGLPIICTANAGADAVVEDGVDGFIIPIRDPQALATRIKTLHNNSELLKELSVNAEKKAQTFTWDNYGDKLASFINSLD